MTASTNPQIDHLNRLISDWNNRCSSYRYYEEDMQAVQQELNAEGARLRREGQAFGLADAFSQPRAGPESRQVEDARLLSPTTSSADAREVQRRLATLGLYTGAVDGVWGLGSKRALAEYKRGVGLPPNPDWDRTTQDRLFFATGR